MSGPWEDYGPAKPKPDDGPWSDYASGAPAAPAPPAKSGAIRRTIGDTALAFGQGAVGAVKSLTDLAGPTNAVSQTLGDIGQGMQGLLSPERQAEMAARQAKVEEADKSGSTLDQVTSRLGGFVEAPLQSTAQGLGSIVPTVAAAVATRGRSLAAQAGTQAAVGAGMGVGSIKGQNYDAVLNEALSRGVPQAEAEALALRASEFNAQNAPQQALGGALGALAGTTGAERIVGGLVSGDKLAKRVIKGALAEGVPEGIQGAQGQYAQNVALNNAGFAVDNSTGVLGQGLLEGAIGTVIGGGFAIPRQNAQPQAEAPAPAPAAAPGQPPAPTTPAGPTGTAPAPEAPSMPAPPPVSGPLTAAVNAMAPQSIGAMPAVPVPQAQELTGAEAARVQREADRPQQAVGEIQPGDITREGKPFTSMDSARRALGKAGPGHELARVRGGLVVRPIAATAAPAARTGPLARFAAEFADGTDTLQRGVLDPGFDAQELSLEEANALTGADAKAKPAKKAEGKTEAIPTPRQRELDAEVVEPASADGLEPNVPPVRMPARTPKPARAMSDDDVVQAYVEQRRNEGTLAGRRFAGDFDAGRITPEDVMALVRPRPAAPTPDERLAAAAAQRQTPAPPPGLVDAEGRPIPTTIRERREQQRQPDVAAPANLAAGASDGRGGDADRGGAPVGRDPADARARQPGTPAGAARRGGAVEPVGAGVQPDQALSTERVKVMTRFGQNVYVDKADLDSDKPRMRHFTSTGKSLGIIVRENLDPTGEKRAADAAETADNPFFDVIGTKDGRVFASEAAAARQRSMDGFVDTHDIVPMRGGFALKRKPKQEAKAPTDAAAPAPQAPPQGRAPEAAAPSAVMPSGLSVTFGGRTFQVDSLQDAQAKWIEFRDRAGAGVSEVGNGVQVMDGAGRMVGRISYNGRIFDSADNMVAEAPDAAAPEPRVSTWTLDSTANPDPIAEFERGVLERPAVQWEDEQGRRLGLESISAGIGRAVGGLGDVVVSIKSEPGVLPLVAEVRAEYQGRRLESRTAEGDAAIKAAVDEYADKIQQARERMTARVASTERGLPAPAPAPTNAPAAPEQTRPEQLIALRKRLLVLDKLLECLG